MLRKFPVTAALAATPAAASAAAGGGGEANAEPVYLVGAGTSHLV